jgi:hypothetical protein
MPSIREKTQRPSISNHASPSDLQTNRASVLLESAKVKLESKGKWGRRVLNLLNIGCEIKPLNGQKTFLSQASRRNFNVVSVMRALVQDTVKPPPLEVPDKLQASRLRRNLVKHHELRQALVTVRGKIRNTPGTTEKQKDFAKFVDDLRRGIEDTVRDVSKLSEKSGEPKWPVGKGHAKLENALWKAFLAAADGTSQSKPEESILAQLSLIDGKSPPSIEPSSPMPAPARDKDAEVCDMLGKALVMSGAVGSDEEVARLLDGFKRANIESQKILDRVLNYCVAHEDDALAKGLVGLALALLADVPEKIDANAIRRRFDSEGIVEPAGDCSRTKE